MMKRVLSVVFAAALLIGLLSVIPVAANATTGMAVSDACVETIKKMEGFVAIPRWDYSQWTVGFGSRCPDEDLARYQKEGIPMDEADALMRKHLQSFENSVNSYATRNGLTLTQSQFDALVCMSYNLGTAMLYNSSGTINRAILDGVSENELIFAFSVYCSAGGEFLPGLIRRRLVEANMYINGVYDDYAPDNYCYVLYNANGGTRDVIAQGYDCNLPAAPWSVPTYEGYTFAGWYTEATGGVRVTALNESHDGMTLYAHWNQGESTSDSSTLPEGGLEVTVLTDAVNVRNGAGMKSAIVGGVFENEKITITGVATVDGMRWGRFAEGWIPLKYTNYGELTGDYDDASDGGSESETIQVPVRATVLSTSGVTVYNGPHTTYPKIGTLSAGEEIEITEVFALFNVNWGKCESGWVQLNLKLQIHDDQRLVHPVTATVNYSFLNVRSGPGIHYSRTSSLKQGDAVQIVAIEYVDDVPWGRFSGGWISLEYTDFDASLLEQYRTHSYGEWYVHKAASCTEAGEERRDCQYCDAYESRGIVATGHSYGEWYESVIATCVAEGQQRRDCAHCDAHETQATELADHSYGEWYESVAATCIAAGQERRDCAHCDAFETRETAVGDHSYGQWQVTVAPTCMDAGEEQRVCAHCNAFETREIPVGGHSYGEWYETVAATCVAAGEERRDCQNCEAFECRETQMPEHNYEAWVTYLESTCAVPGEERRICAGCGTYESRELPLAKHSLGQWYETVVPSVESAGEERRDCENCEYFETREIEPTEHIYGEWYEVLAPTCTEVGQQNRDCQHCEQFQTREVPALGHSMGQWVTVTEPSCEEDGQQSSTCDNCGHSETRVLTALGHNFDKWIELEAPTCMENGKQGRVCLTCTYLQAEDVAATGHVYSDWKVLSEPTCITDGEQFRICTVCSEAQQENIPASGHTFGEWYVVAEVACGQIGEERRDCGACDFYESRQVAVTEHTFTDWYIYKEAVCDQAGEERRTCTNCKQEENREIAAPGHSYGDWYIYEEATCDQAGEERRTCTNCKQEESREIVALGHSYGDWYTYAEATCDQAGEERRVCTGCKQEENREIAAPGHSYGKWYIYKEAACGVNGEARRDCTVCGQSESLTIKSEAHVFDQWYVAVKPTCETAGEERRECSRCGAFESRDIAAIGHSYGAWYMVVEPTATAEGEERRVCANCGHYESRPIERLQGTVTKVYGVVKDYCVYIRAGAGSNYAYKGALFFGDRVEILERTTLSTGDVWGRIGEKQWVALSRLNLETVEEAPEQIITKIHATVTCDVLNIRSEAGVYANIVGKLLKADVVEVLERQDVDGLTWGRIEQGWICLTDNTTLDVQTTVVGGAAQVNVTIHGTITASTLNIREQAGTNHAIVGYLGTYDEVEILEMAMVNWAVWGRIERGWIRLDGYVKLKRIVEETTVEHAYGDWYVTQEATCTEDGQERRNCSRCGEYETRVIAATGHTFGQWKVIQEGNCTMAAEKARVCSGCGHVEIQIENTVGHAFGEWAVFKAPGCATIGSEVRICVNCGLEETRELPATGHSFGAWYETKAPTVEAEGEARRDCSACGGYETKIIEKLINTTTDITKLYATITYTYLTIRAGAGTGYTKLGTLYQGDTVELLEVVTVGNDSWGRFAKGWICLTGYTSLKTTVVEGTASEHMTMHATITYTYLSIRAGAGTGYTKLGTLSQGDTVELFEIVVSGGNSWGRFSGGWICLTGYTKMVASSES